MSPASRGSIGRVAVGGVAVIGALAGIRRLVGAWPRVTIEGASMEPALLPGDRLLFSPIVRLRAGDIVALPDPRASDRLLVKRIKSIDRRNGLVSVEGDNRTGSTDSRVFGPVARRAIVGRAVYRYAPAGRAGPVGGTR